MGRLIPALVLALVAATALEGVSPVASEPASDRSTQAPAITFADHVAPIVYGNCTPCHRPDGAAPFSLLTYEDVAKRGRQIAGVTGKRSMPPWHAEPGSYPFKDERRLSDAQIALIREWVRAGMPRGDVARLPAVPVFTSTWRLGEPDLIVDLPSPYTVPAEGPDVYRNFVVPLNLAEDKWIRAIELRPTAGSVVHHVLYFSDVTGAARRSDAADPEPGYKGMGARLRSTPLGGWAMGQQPHAYPDGVALPLPKGADLVLQYHFHPSGKRETEHSRIGLYFADRAPERHLANIQLPVLFGFFSGIDIPAGESAYRISDSFVLPVDVDGVAIGAHAHYLGREMKMTATLPGGEQKTLLWIRKWDFAWQDRYFFEQFVPLAKGTRLDVAIAWDNSADNPDNPSNPPARVTWGERSTDEMGGVTLQVLPRHQSDLTTLQRAYRRHVLDSMREDPTALAAVFFVTHDCPISNRYAPEIRRICETYGPRGVACSLVYVDPSLTDDAARTHAREFGHGAYPILVDRDHVLVRETGAEIAPQVVLVNADTRVVYSGRIDDQPVEWGTSRRHVRTHDLREALDALLAGRAAPKPTTQAVGCVIADLSRAAKAPAR